VKEIFDKEDVKTTTIGAPVFFISYQLMVIQKQLPILNNKER
jgi:hypothetical protein